MTDVLSGSIGIALGQQRVRRLRQRRVERVRENRSKVWRSWIAVGRGAAYPEEFISRGTCRISAEQDCEALAEGLPYRRAQARPGFILL